MSAPAFTLTANLSNLLGGGQGYLKISLINPNVSQSPVKVSGTALLALMTYVTPIASSVSVTLWGLDVLSPSNCYYKVECFNAGSTLTWVASYNNFVGSGTQDLSTLTPMNQPSFSAPSFTQSNANTFYAGPSSGGAGVPTMRDIVDNDLTAASTAIVGSKTGSQSLHGPLTVSNLNTTLWVDGVVYTTVQAAINALPASGGTVMIPAGTYAGPTTIPSGTALIGMSASEGVGLSTNPVILQYTSSLTLTNVSNTRWENVWFDFSPAASAAGLELKAFNASGNAFCVQNSFRNVVINQAGGTSVPALKLSASGSGGTISNSYNSFENLIVYGNSTTGSNPGPALAGILLVGSGTPNAGPTVTQNYFSNVFVRGGLKGGVDLELNTDTNYFSKISVLQEWLSTPSGSYGLGFNLTTPGSDQDADACFFYGFNLTGGFTSTIRTGQATGHIIDLTGFNSVPVITVTGGTPQFSGRICNLNGGASSPYNFLGSTFTIMGLPTTTVKVGTQNSSNYTTSSTSFADVDSTNLAYTVTVPVGWKLLMWASGQAQIATASVQGIVNLTDTSTSTVITSADIIPALNTQSAFSMQGALTGDGNSHVIKMQFKTTNVADAFSIGNNTFGFPQILFILMPSN